MTRLLQRIELAVGLAVLCTLALGAQLHRQAEYRRHGKVALQDKFFTPGVIRTKSKDSVCNGGSTEQYRNTPERAIKEAFAAYGIPWSEHARYEADHLVSLELGGADPTCIRGQYCEIRNIWPQPYEPRPGAHEKDLVENYLHRQVCSGSMKLEDAQKKIVDDWYRVYLEAGLNKKADESGDSDLNAQLKGEVQ